MIRPAVTVEITVLGAAAEFLDKVAEKKQILSLKCIQSAVAEIQELKFISLAVSCILLSNP